MHWNEIHYSVTFCHSPVKLSLCCNFFFAGWRSPFILSVPTGLLDICTCPLTSLVVPLRLNTTSRIKLVVPMKFKNCHLVGFFNHVCKGISAAQMVLVWTGCRWGEAVVGPCPTHPLLGAPGLQQLLSKLCWAKCSPRVENSWHELLQCSFINKMKFISVSMQCFCLCFSSLRCKGPLLSIFLASHKFFFV